MLDPKVTELTVEDTVQALAKTTTTVAQLLL